MEDPAPVLLEISVIAGLEHVAITLLESRAVAARRPVLAWSPHPLLLAKERELVYEHFLPNETIIEYLKRTGLLERLGRQPFTLTVDGRRLPRTLWAHCRPKPGTLINLYATVRGGDGKKNPIATVAMLALLYFSAGTTAAPGWAAQAAAATGIGTAAIWHAGIMVVGGMIIPPIFAAPWPRKDHA